MPIGFGGQSRQRWGDNTVNAREYMRDILLTDTKDQPRSTAQARKSGMVLLVFFDPEDASCGDALQTLQRLADAYGDSGKLTVWGVSQGDKSSAEAFAARSSVSFPLLLDRENWHSMIYGVSIVPTVFLADSSGVVLAKMVGWRPKAIREFSAQIAAILEREPVDVLAAASAAA